MSVSLFEDDYDSIETSGRSAKAASRSPPSSPAFGLGGRRHEPSRKAAKVKAAWIIGQTLRTGRTAAAMKGQTA